MDGCSYTFGDFTISQAYDGVDGTSEAVPIRWVGLTREFTRGAEGKIQTDFEVTITETGSVVEAYSIDGTCNVQWNGNACACEQRWCDASEQQAGNYVDCSAFEGGGIVDFCFLINNPTAPLLTEQSTPMEIVWFLPNYACLDGIVALASASPPDAGSSSSTTGATTSTASSIGTLPAGRSFSNRTCIIFSMFAAAAALAAF